MAVHDNYVVTARGGRVIVLLLLLGCALLERLERALQKKELLLRRMGTGREAKPCQKPCHLLRKCSQRNASC